jgi:hypothetical protein
MLRSIGEARRIPPSAPLSNRAHLIGQSRTKTARQRRIDLFGRIEPVTRSDRRADLPTGRGLWPPAGNGLLASLFSMGTYDSGAILPSIYRALHSFEAHGASRARAELYAYRGARGHACCKARGIPTDRRDLACNEAVLAAPAA